MSSKWIAAPLCILGIALVAYSIVPQYRYGLWRDPEGLYAIGGIAVPYGTAALMIILHVAKIALVAAIVPAWRRGHCGAAIIATLIVFCLAVLSLWNGVSSLTLNRNERVASTHAVVQRDTDLRAELKTIGERLALVGWRPLAAVAAEIAAERRQQAWDNTSACKQIKTGADRRYCARLDRLEGEREVAFEAEGLRAREADVRRMLDQQPIATSNRHPDIALLASVVGVSPDTADLLQSIAWCLIVEIVEVTLFWFAGLLARTPPSEPVQLASVDLHRAR